MRAGARDGGRQMERNTHIDLALSLVADGRNVLITGRAGTGKSTLLAEIRDESDGPTAVVAPTGVAALNVGGQTIHRFFGFPPTVTVEDVVSGKVFPRRNAELIANLERLIIDEVSMVRADHLDCVDASLRRWGRVRGAPFGGVQVVLVGDPYQLPPVVTDDAAAHFATHYQSPHFFAADALTKLDYEIVELVDVFRQTDPTFVDILNGIRDNSVTDSHLRLLNERVDPDFVPPPDDLFVTLTTRREVADSVNDGRLDTLDGDELTSSAVITGQFTDRPTKSDLRYKIGAQVMMLNNDPDDRWVNGSLAVVTGVNDQARHAVSVLVVDTGELVEVEPFTWTIAQPGLDRGRLTYEEVGTFRQLPFDLAWAVTIHKAQGKTFDRVVIDLGQGTFADGQLYVALSRCRSLDGLVLRQPVERRHIKVNGDVVRFLGRDDLAPQPLKDMRVASVAAHATGHGRHDRVVEFAVVITEGGRVVDEHHSIVHPMRDLTGAAEHGVTASMASMAPSFAETWAAVAPTLAGCVLAGDGLAPLVRLLHAELDRVDGATAQFGAGLCVRTLFGTNLDGACANLGIDPVESVRAIDRARTVASLMLASPERSVECSPVSAVEVGWEVPRLQRRPASTETLTRRVPDGPYDEPEAPYARLWAVLLDDGGLDHAEHAELAGLADRLGLDPDDRTRVHATYCDSMVTAANRDAEVTDNEWAYIVAVHADLGLTPPPRPVPVDRVDVQLARGMRVCITGLRDSGSAIGEDEVERLLLAHGLAPVGSVTAACGLLVTAERSSMSKKASRARQHGIPILEVDELLALLDTGDIADGPPPVPNAVRQSPQIRRSRTSAPAAALQKVKPVNVDEIPKGLPIARYSRATLRSVVAHVDPDGSLNDVALLNGVIDFLEFTNRSTQRVDAIGQAIDAERGDEPGTFADQFAAHSVATIEATQAGGHVVAAARSISGESYRPQLVLTPGMRVCFTGDAKVGGERVDRKHLEDAAKRFGLVPTGAVSGRTDVLICPDDYDEGRTKFVKALKLGVRLMTVAEFVTQIPLEEG